MNDHVSDAELVDRARRGDRSAFGELITRHRPAVVRGAARITGDAELAGDLAQEAILQAYLSLDHLREPARFPSWLYGIMLNVCRSSARDNRATFYSYEAVAGGVLYDAVALAGQWADPQRAAEARELDEAIQAAVHALAPENRAATLLYYYDGLSVQEIAETLGISRAAVKGRLFKSRQRLRAQLLALAGEWIETKGRREMIQVIVADVVKRERKIEGAPPYILHIVVLYDEAGQRALPIWVGPFEGQAIAMGVLGETTPRPMTYEFIAKLLDAAQVKLESIQVQSLQEDVYYASVNLKTGEHTMQVDARPSDAIALALRANCPIHVSEELFERGGMSVPKLERPAEQPPRGVDAMMKEFAAEYQAQWSARKSAPQSDAELEQSKRELVELVFGAGA